MTEITKAQRELLTYIADGGVVHYISGIDARYFKSDNFKTCTRQALALIQKGLVGHKGGWGRETLRLTKNGLAASEIGRTSEGAEG